MVRDYEKEPLTLAEATAIFEGMTDEQMDRAERMLDLMLSLEARPGDPKIAADASD